MQRLQFLELSPNLQEKLTQIYGKQPLNEKSQYANKIIYLRELNDQEKNLVSANFVTQTLYKFSGMLNTFKFSREVHSCIESAEELRTNYCSGDEKNFAVVLKKNITEPEITFQNLQNLDDDELDGALKKLMEADMRRDFNLQKGNLIRFSIFHTKDSEYAILVTAAKILLEKFNVEEFLKNALGVEYKSLSTKPAFEYQPQLESSIREYWAKILKNLPKKQNLPYLQPARQNEDRQTYRAVIPAGIMSDVKKIANTNRIMLMTMLQTAWGLMLQEYNETDDAAYCLFVPSKDKNGRRINTFPMRLNNSEELTVEKLVRNQFQQILISRPYSQFDWSSLNEISGESEIFDHFLNFNEFMAEDQPFTQIETQSKLELVTQNSWQAKDFRLGIYFNYSEDEVSMSVMYSKNRLEMKKAAILSKRYLMTLNQMLTSWNSSVAKCKNNLKNRILAERNKIPPEDEKAQLQNFVSKTQLLHGIKRGVLQTFMKAAKFSTKFEGDRIFDEELTSKLIFLVEGRAALSIESNSGWYNVLEMKIAGLPLNENIFLSEKKYKVAAEILSEQAVILEIPIEDMRAILNQNPELWQNIAEFSINELANYKKLWIKS